MGQNKVLFVWGLLDRSYKVRALYLLLLMMLGLFFEMLGVSMIVPMLSFILYPEHIKENYILVEISSLLGNPTYFEFVTYFILTVIGAGVLRILILAILSWKQYYFTFNVQAQIANKLYGKYIHQPYSFHLSSNTSSLIRNITYSCDALAAHGVGPVLQIIVESAVILGLSSILFYTEPLGTVFVIIIIGFGSLFVYFFTKNKISRMSKDRQEHESQRLKQLQHGLSGSREAKLFSCESYFISRHRFHELKRAELASKQSLLQSLPRIWLEFLIVLTASLLVLFLVAQEESPEDILPTLGLFAAVGFRLLPSANRLVTSFQSVSHAIPIINNLIAEFEKIKLNKQLLNNKNNNINFANLININNLSYKYPGSDLMTLRSLSLKVSYNECIGIMGESGSGKSTFINLLMGLLSPQEGSIIVDSKNIAENYPSWQKQIGYVPQTIFLIDDTIRRNIAFGVEDKNIDENKLQIAVKQAQLHSYIDSLNDGYDTQVGERGVRISGGQLQRIGIARALYNNPMVLIFDEATSALDKETEKTIMSVIEDLAELKTIIIISHNIETLSSCDNKYRLIEGKLEMLH